MLTVLVAMNYSRISIKPGLSSFWPHPHHRKIYDKGENDLCDLHGIVPHFIHKDPYDEGGEPRLE